MAGLIYPFFISPLWGRVTVLQADIVERDNTLKEIELFIARRNELAQKFESFTIDDRDRLEKIFPKKVQVIERIVDLEALIVKSSLKLEGAIQPTGETGGSGAVSGSEGIKKIGFSFSVTGKYENLLAFLNELSKSLSLYDIKTLNFSSQESGILFTFDMDIETNQIAEAINEIPENLQDSRTNEQ